MIRSAIRAQVRESTGDLDGISISDARVNAFIDIEIDEVYTRFDFDTAVATISSVEGEPNYQLPSNCINIKEVFVTLDDDKEYRFEVLDQSDMASRYGTNWRGDANSRPLIAYRADYNVLGIYPEPNAANAGKTIRAFYHRMGSALASDSDSPAFFTALHMAVAYGSAARCFDFLGDRIAAKDHRAYKEAELLKYKHKMYSFSDEGWQMRFG